MCWLIICLIICNHAFLSKSNLTASCHSPHTPGSFPDGFIWWCAPDGFTALKHFTSFFLHYLSQSVRNVQRLSFYGAENRCFCVTVQGLRPLKDSVFVVFWRRVLQRDLVNSSAVVKCDGLASGAFPGCVTRCFTLTSRFLPSRPEKVTIYVTRCRQFLSFFLLFWVHKESWDMWGHEGS